MSAVFSLVSITAGIYFICEHLLVICLFLFSLSSNKRFVNYVRIAVGQHGLHRNVSPDHSFLVYYCLKRCFSRINHDRWTHEQSDECCSMRCVMFEELCWNELNMHISFIDHRIAGNDVNYGWWSESLVVWLI